MKRLWNEWAWEAWCIASGIGIWPRYVEPNLLSTTKLSLSIPHLPSELVGLKILHFSDLHWNKHFSSYFQNKLIHRVNALNPDFIFFTGDFICRSKLENEDQLKLVLQSLRANLGCYAVLGNHDYDCFVTVNTEGHYDIEASSSTISKGFKRLFSPVSLTQQVTKRAGAVGWHENLMALLEQTPFKVLNNTTQLVAYKGKYLNICGLEDFYLGRFNPKQAFQNYDSRYPGIILSHNPDTFEILKDYPGDIILSGHTHGGQVNLPILWKRFTDIKYLQFKRGLKRVGTKWGYVNRGISSVMRFRWLAIPELTLITLNH